MRIYVYMRVHEGLAECTESLFCNQTEEEKGMKISPLGTSGAGPRPTEGILAPGIRNGCNIREPENVNHTSDQAPIEVPEHWYLNVCDWLIVLIAGLCSGACTSRDKNCIHIRKPVAGAASG